MVVRGRDNIGDETGGIGRPRRFGRQRLDDEGRKGVRLPGCVWEELLAEAIARTHGAEHILWLLYDRASDGGVIFDFAKAAAEWDAEHDRRPMVLLPLFEAFVAARAEKLYEMRVRLRRSYDGQLRATIRTHKERDRADAVEAQLDALLAGIAWLEAPGVAQRHRH